MSENRGEAGEGRNATDTHERHTRGRGAHLCAHHYRKKDGERKKVGEEERGKKKKKRFRGRLLRYAKETVGNRASRNADADKGNPYDRFWCAGYLRSVSVYSDGTTGEDVFTPRVREISKFLFSIRLFRSSLRLSSALMKLRNE